MKSVGPRAGQSDDEMELADYFCMSPFPYLSTMTFKELVTVLLLPFKSHARSSFIQPTLEPYREGEGDAGKCSSLV